ncbi:carbohydrate ABC transporter substrate-binding protein, CUT1 family [Paenibacillus sp. yr247]|uniref:ABC transporter substrate-binding protein n=1 Tax=Paenibacillus sp. yr247 TaxID=1761880 RepID=UPI00088684AB|nr:sugar ABC transporter substrate-binding protein [Paenibacillus sp. yr247]SDP09423.1 carbohydrate ABC transporter substrate-binding protein, CUT1 family [Paenibacillus sp. yr247]
MRKLLFGKISTILLLTMTVTACGTNPSTSKSSTSPDGKPTTLTFAVAEYDAQMKTDMQDVINRFQTENPNIKVNLLTSNWDDFHDRLVTWIAGNQAPDIANLSGLWVGEFNDMGVLQPVEQYVDKPFLSSFYQAPLNSFKKDDKLFGLPFFLDPRVLYYRKDLFAQKNLAPPKTWDDIYNAAKALNDPPNVYGFGVGGKYPNVMTGFEYFYFNASPKVAPLHFGPNHELLYDSADGVKALSFLSKLVSEKLTNPNPTDVEWENGVQPIFQSGKLAMMITGPWFAGMLDQDKKVEYGMVPMPTGEANMQSHAVMEPDVISVFNGDKTKKDAIGKFLAYLYKSDNRLTFAINHGNIPEIESVGKDPKWADLPNNKFFASQLDNAINKYSDTGKYGDQFDHIVTDEIQKMYLKGQTPVDALKQSAAKTKDLYNKK